MIQITHNITFDFREREAADLEKLNRVLSHMRLKDLKLKEPQGYLEVTRDGEGNLVHKRYGLDRGVLIGTPSKNGDRYQIDTVVLERSVDSDEFLEIWRSNHRDRILRSVIILEFDEALGLTILHHQK